MNSDATLIAVGAQRAQIEEATERALDLVRATHTTQVLRIMSDHELLQAAQDATEAILPSGILVDVVNDVAMRVMLLVRRTDRTHFDVV